MTTNSTTTKRIAKNTIFLYVRSLFSLFVSLYSSRLILQALGTDDYGTYNVVGGFVSMFWLVSGSLSSAVTRFLNFEMGRGNQEQMKKVFSMSLSIMLLLALVVLLLTETFGLWFLHHRMEIPPGRETAAFWVFQFSVITILSGFAIVPFNSSIIANERMEVYAYLGVAEAILRLIIALFLAFGHLTADKLILYALLWLVSSIMLQIAAVVFCRLSFPECRIHFVFDKRLFKEMFSYAGWNFMGSISKTFSGQGVNVVLNIAFGTAVNAARGLAGTINNAVGMLYNNLILAINPQVTKSYASGDRQFLKSLTFLGTKFCFFIFFLVALPLFLEADFVLSLWLVEVPEHTANFVRLVLVITLFDLFSAIFNMAIFATGTIRNFQVLTSIMIFLIFPASQIALKMGGNPESTYFINLLIIAVNSGITLWFVRKLLGFSLHEIISQVYFRILLTVLLSVIFPVILHEIMPMGWSRLILIILFSLACSSIAILFVGCSKQERLSLLHDYVIPYFGRFKRNRTIN